MLTTLVPSALLLITPFDTSLFAKDTCYTENYYGSFGGQGIFRVDLACFEGENLALDAGSIVPVFKQPEHLVWVEAEVVEQSLLAKAFISTASPLDELFDRLSTAGHDATYTKGQVVISSKEAYEVLYRTESSALVSLSAQRARIIDTLLPQYHKSILLPTVTAKYVPVSAPDVNRVKHILRNLRFDPVVANIVNDISLSQMKRDIRWLTGEDEKSTIKSRHSFAEGSRVAANWLKGEFESTGATCEFREFLAGFAPNIICRYPSAVKTNATVLLSAHYDSRGSFGSTRAPGGDDDGSGVVAILGIARTILLKRLTFRSNVELVAFAGEEQGLLGSRAYARELKAAGANLTVMLQADMLAYHVPGEAAQLGLPETIGTPEVTQLVANISAIYSPELVVGFTKACCSDHQSFHEQGFAATQVFERAGPIADPMYHNSGDLSEREGYDLSQVKSIAKVEFATLLHAAGFDLPDDEEL